MKNLKKPLLWIGTLCICVVLILFIVPQIMDFRGLRQVVNAQLSKKMRAHLEFSSAHLSFAGHIGLIIKDVSFVNDDKDFADTPMLHADEVFLALAPGELLRRNLVISVHVPASTFVHVTKSEKTNISALALEHDAGMFSGAPAKTPPAPTVSTKDQASALGIAGLTFHDLALREIDIQNMAVELAGDGYATPKNIASLSADLKSFQNGIPQDVSLKGNVTYEKNGAVVSGPFTGTALLSKQSADVKDVLASLNFSDLNIETSSLKKPKSVPLNLDAHFINSSGGTHLENGALHIGSLSGSLDAQVKDLESWTGEAALDFKNQKLSDLSALLPNTPTFSGEGGFNASAHVSGQLNNFKSLRLIASITEATPKSDLLISLHVDDFAAPFATAAFTSKHFEPSALFIPGFSNQTPLLTRLTADSLEMRVVRNGDSVSVGSLTAQICGGSISGNGHIDLTANHKLELDVSLNDASVHDVAHLVRPAAQDMFDGRGGAKVNLVADTLTHEMFESSLHSKGNFYLKQVSVSTPVLQRAVQREVERNLKTLDVQGGAAKILAQVNALTQDPKVKKWAQSNGIDLNRFKNPYAGLVDMTLGSDGTNTDLLKAVDGKFETADHAGKFSFDTTSEDGSGKVEGMVDAAGALSGQMTFLGSEKLKNRMLSRSRFAKLLFDAKGDFPLQLSMSGTLEQPALKLDVDSLKDRISKNSEKLSDRDLEIQANKLLQQIAKLKAGDLLSALGQKPPANPDAKKTPGANPEQIEINVDDLKKKWNKNKDKLNELFK